MFLSINLAISLTAAPTRQDLFVPTPRYPCFRQPAIITTSTGAILAFAENRNVSACAPAAAVTVDASGSQPNEIGSLLLRRSIDGGSTWTPLQVVYASPSPGIDFYVALEDAVTKVRRERDCSQTYNMRSFMHSLTPSLLPPSLPPTFRRRGSLSRKEERRISSPRAMTAQRGARRAHSRALTQRFRSQ